jgi:hypothetical protein
MGLLSVQSVESVAADRVAETMVIIPGSPYLLGGNDTSRVFLRNETQGAAIGCLQYWLVSFSPGVARESLTSIEHESLAWGHNVQLVAVDLHVLVEFAYECVYIFRQGGFILTNVLWRELWSRLSLFACSIMSTDGSLLKRPASS